MQKPELWCTDHLTSAEMEQKWCISQIQRGNKKTFDGNYIAKQYTLAMDILSEQLLWQIIVQH